MKITNVLIALMGTAATTTAFIAPSLPISTVHKTSSSALMMSAADAPVSRRSAITAAGAFAAASGLTFSGLLAQPAYADGPYSLPALPYPYEELEPHIDAATMKFHHDKHHAAYVANTNKAMAGKEAPSLLDLQAGAIKAGVRNAGGGHYNHCLFWNTLINEKSSGSPSAALTMAIDASFGSFDAMKEKFAATAAGVFGSGWAWLGVTKEGKLEITSTPNQDNPLMEGAICTPMVPILGLDVWEHAYYLKYQNRRPEYIAAFWNVVHWAKVSEYYEKYGLTQKGVPVEG